MKNFILHFTTVTFTLLNHLVDSQCTSYYTQPDLIEAVVQTKYLQIDLKSQKELGIGFWMTYRPQDDDIVPQNPDAVEQTNEKQLFIFSFKSIDSGVYSLLLFSFLYFEQKKIYHSLIFETAGGTWIVDQPMDYDSYEGSWLFFYCFIDQAQEFISYNHYNLQSNKLNQQILSGKLILSEEMEIIIGGYKNTRIHNFITFNFQAYPGYFMPVISKFEDFFFNDIYQFLFNCQPQEDCKNTQYTLIDYNTQKIDEIFSKKYDIKFQSYLIKGWIKQDKLINFERLETVLLRISRSQDYLNNNNQEGDKILYVTYYLDNNNLELNGFSLQTYSYQYPWKTDIYVPEDTDTINVLGEKFKDLLTQWHYFSFEIGTLANNGQPIYKVYYAAAGIVEQYTWLKQINHFTSKQLFFSIGGDKYSSMFQGYLSDWVISFFCDKQEAYVEPKCHYSCKSCKGISSQDCTSCEEEDFRVYSTSQNTCKCKYGYIDKPDTSQCLEFHEYNSAFTFYEKKLSNLNQGYYEQDQCDFGYFKHQNTCIQCPYAVQENEIKCADCILYPEVFSEKLNCTFSFNSTDKFSVFNYYLYTFKEVELYNISQTRDQTYYLQLREGFQNDIQCKLGYFKINDECQECIEGCLKCDNAYYCAECQTKYINDNGICLECLNCAFIYQEDTDDAIIVSTYCPERMYLKGNKCYDCGNHCKKCQWNKCYHCEDDSQYFLTLDQLNCAKCTIENCQYCFQFYINSDQTIITSLDFNTNTKLIYSELFTGCALCKEDYFFSFVTFKCELKPYNMADCETGIYLDNLGSSQCLVSKTRQDAIQQSICQDQLCLSCINNYSKHIMSFCIICKDGYYSSFKNGECVQCPQNCYTCAEFNYQEADQWKWNIRAFYKFFVNKNNEHPFESNQISSLNVICLTCEQNYIIKEYICVLVCSEDCTDCLMVTDLLDRPLYKCNQCKPQTFNSQRSVVKEAISQCLACPEYCSACHPRTPEQIKAINPFFNQTSSFLKYTNICYQTEIFNHESTVTVQPFYMIPKVCEQNEKCVKIFQASYYMFCDDQARIFALGEEINEYVNTQYPIFPPTMFDDPESTYLTVLFQQLNQFGVSEIVFDFEIMPYLTDFECYFSGVSIMNNFKVNVFALKSISLIFRKSQKVLYEKLPIILYEGQEFKQFNNITFKGIQFKWYDSYLDTPKPLTIVSFVNDYDPVIVIFENCEIVQNWDLTGVKSAEITFLSRKAKQLTILQMNLEGLKVTNGSIFDFQPYHLGSFQQITNLVINNSNFSNTNIFLYNAELQIKSISLINVTVLNTNFSNSYFINSSFQFNYTIGEFFLENIHLENLILKDKSTFFHVVSAIQFSAKNLTIKNVTFLDSSSFIVCNIINLNQLLIYHSFVSQGYFLKIHTLSNQLELIYITISNISFINNTYSISSQNPFIQILQQELTMYNFTCINLLLDNNVLTNSGFGKQSFIYVSYKFSLIYIECNTCVFKDLIIFRGIGLPEISILNSQSLEIHNLQIETGKQYYSRSLHSSAECSKRFIYQDIPFVLYIWSYSNVQIDNAIVQNAIIANYQLIILLGKSRTEANKEETISITNSILKNNLLLVINENKQSSIISIDTEQVSSINIQNLKFTNNFINLFYQNTMLHSSASLLINAESAYVTLSQLVFKNNIISNSSDSVLYILAKSVIIMDCQFYNQNILNNEFYKNIIITNKSTLNEQDIKNSFQIISAGGNGYIETSYLWIKDTVIRNSLALNGGGFYITTLADGIFIVTNCSFFNTSTVLSYNQLASGGLFYIDSSKSNLNLTISNCFIQQTYARTYGGAIYIDASKQSNLIYLENSIIHSVFSIQHSFLSFSPKRQFTISSKIKIYNLNFENTEQEFEIFARQLGDLSEQNVILFQIDNPLIYVQFANLTVLNCQFNNIYLAYLMEIYQGIEINLQKINVLNSTIFQSPIIKLNLRPDTKGFILFQNVYISNLKSFIPGSYDCIQLSSQIFGLICPKDLLDINNQPSVAQNQQPQDNQLNCNLNLLYQIIQSQLFSIIEYNDLKQTHLIQIYDLKMAGIKCDACQYGVLNIKNFENQLNLQIGNIQIIDNFCGIFGCVSIIKSVDINLVPNSSDTTQTKKLSDEITDQIIFNTSITNSIFINNTASYGGACFLSKINILINSTEFMNNQATFYGGSIYYDSDQTTLLIINSKMVRNKAQIGGALYLQNQQLQRLDYLNLVLEENDGLYFANNLFETPRYLYLSLDKTNAQKNIQVFSNSTTQIEKISIAPYQTYKSKIPTEVLLMPSGTSISNYNYFNPETNSYIKLNQSLRLQAENTFGERISNLQNTECSISAYIINISKPLVFNNFTINNTNTGNFLSKSNFVFNIDTGDYNLDDLIIYFNPFQEKQLQLQLAFQCNSIRIPFYNTSTNQLSSMITNYILLLNLRTYECQLGEYLNQASGGCVLCDTYQSQYSITINASICSYKDETKISEIQPAMIKLRPSYWRAYYYSEIIEICHNSPTNCEGGWLAGDPSCAFGHIGALCEQCDLYNIKGSGEFSQNQSFQCSNCDQIASNIFNIVSVFLWTLISVFITVASTIKMIDDFILQLKLKPLSFFNIVKTVSTSALIKIFTNYLQIVSSVASFQLSIPIGITLVYRGIGNPIGSVAFSFDCYLKYYTGIPILYLRIIWGIVISIMYFLLFFFYHVLEITFFKKQFNLTLVATAFIYVYIYLSPNLVSQLSFLVSYRNISGQKWIGANVAYLYNTNSHRDWLIYFFTPTFLIIAILLPFFFWYIVYHYRFQLNSKKVKRIWGYLYNEYKIETYYWETIKIIQKELIIFILIYYQDFVPIKACLIFFLLHIYSKLTQKFKPYLTEKLNQIDSLSTSICQISIVLAQSIYLAQELNIKEVVWPFYAILGIINFYFIFEIISKLLSAYFIKFNHHVNKLKVFIYTYIPNNMKKNKFCMRILRNTTERNLIVRQRYQKLRKFLMSQAKLIISFKQQLLSYIILDKIIWVQKVNKHLKIKRISNKIKCLFLHSKFEIARHINNEIILRTSQKNVQYFQLYNYSFKSQLWFLFIVHFQKSFRNLSFYLIKNQLTKTHFIIKVRQVYVENVIVQVTLIYQKQYLIKYQPHMHFIQLFLNDYKQQSLIIKNKFRHPLV